jgi:hypothetical protein
LILNQILYRVTLTGEERALLMRLIKQGKTAGYRIRHAHLLLALDEIPCNAEWTDATLAKAYHSSPRSIGTLRKRFIEEGFEAALERKKRSVPPVIKIDGEAEAKIIAVTCSKPPEGRCRWTFQLLADKVAELEMLESISPMALCTLLKKQHKTLAA